MPHTVPCPVLLAAYSHSVGHVPNLAVVSSLVEKDGQRAAHIGYKENPLTDLLKCGIGGNSKTALVACLTAASDSLDESLNTLRFAVQARLECESPATGCWL